MPQTKTTVTNTTTSNNNTPTFKSSSSSYRSPLPRWRSFNTGLQRTLYQYGNTPRNNYPRQFFQNTNGNFFTNSPQNPSSASNQNWLQFNQRPRFLQRQHMRMNRPRSSVQKISINQETNAVMESKTRKRKLKSQQSGESQRAQKPWNRADAVKAIAAEMELRTPKNNQQIMIRFPDHEITRQIVQNFHSDIKSVHFHTPCNPRYCYVQVQPSANIEDVATALNETVFNHDKLRVEIKESQFEEKAIPECVDPYTLYLGNLPTNITSNAVKDQFPKASRVDIGFAKKMKYTRYAFIKFSNAEDAIQAYKDKYNLVIDSRSVVLRFRRGKGNLNPPGQVDKLPNEKNDFDIQSVQKKIKHEPVEVNEMIDEFESPINVSGFIKPEMMEEDEYEYDSVYESDITFENDINIKSECSDNDEEYYEQYYEESVKDEDDEWKLDDSEPDEFKMPYTFVPKKIMLTKNYKELNTDNKTEQKPNDSEDEKKIKSENQTEDYETHSKTSDDLSDVK